MQVKEKEIDLRTSLPDVREGLTIFDLGSKKKMDKFELCQRHPSGRRRE